MVRVVRGDITELEVDVIVNAANSHLMVGGGVDYAIHQASGPGLKNEIDSQAKYLEPGGVLLTSGYLLPAKHVIHTVAPRWSGGNDAEFDVLFTCYAESIELAMKKGMKSIAFPALGAGAFGVPAEVTAEAAVRAIAEFDFTDDEFEVILCCYSQEDFDTFTTTIQRIIDEAKKEQELPDCPICFWPMVPILYGMLAPSDKDDFIAGGCSIEPNAPQIGCKNCGWEGDPESLTLSESVTFAVLDEAKQRFVGGVGFKTSAPDSAWTIVPGKYEYGFWSMPEMKSAWDGVGYASLWIAQDKDIMQEALFKLESQPYVTVTSEVMEFAGFRRVRDFPRFREKS